MSWLWVLVVPLTFLFYFFFFMLSIVSDDAVGLKSMKGTVTVESSASQEQLDQLKAACDAHCPLVDTIKGPTPVALTWKRPDSSGTKK